MAVRYYLSTVAGTGTAADPFRPKLADLFSGNWQAVDGRASPSSSAGRMLVWCDPTDQQHATLVADAGITYCPFETTGGAVLGLSDTLAQIDATKRNQISTFLENNHIPVDDLTGSDTIKALLRRVARRYCGVRQLLGSDDYTEGLETLVSSIAAAKRNRINSRLTSLGFNTAAVAGSDTIRTAIKKLAAQAVKYMRTQWD